MDEELSVTGEGAWNPDLEIEEEEKDYKVELSKLIAKNNKLQKKAAEAEEWKKKYEEIATKAQEKEEILKEVYTQKTQIETEKEKQAFYLANPYAKEFEAGVEDLAQKLDIPRDKALQYYIAEHKPELLVDEQFQNKLKANIYATKGTWSAPQQKEIKDMKPQEVKAWLEEKAREQQRQRWNFLAR